MTADNSPLGVPSTSGSHTGAMRFALIVILLFGLVLRLGLAFVHGLSATPQLNGDEDECDTYAWNLAQGQGYRGMSPDIPDRNHLTAWRPPGASLLMAGIFATVGHRYDAVRIVHCILGTCSIWMTFLIGRRTFNATVGLIGATIYALYPLAVLQSTELLSEPLGVFLFLVFINGVLAFSQRPTWYRALFAGLVLGVGLLTRANYVMMIPLTVVWLVWQYRTNWRVVLKGVAIVAVALAILAPWTIRNYRVFGAFVPFSTGGGSVLLQGNNSVVVSDPKYYGYNVWDTTLPEYREALQTAGNEVERDRRARQFAIQWLKDHPDKWGFLLWHKFLRSWTPLLIDNPSAAQRWIYLLSWGPILVLFILAIGPTAYIGLRYRHSVLFLHLAILHYVVNSLIFFALVRYRAPIDPLCVILASATLTWIAYRIGYRQVGNPFSVPKTIASTGQPMRATVSLPLPSGHTT